MTLYDENELQLNINKRKNTLIQIIIFSIVIALTITITGFFINDNTIKIIKTIDYIVGILLGWYVIGLIIFKFIPLKKRYNHVYNIINCEKITITGKFIGIGNDYTLQNSVKGREIKVDTFDRHYTLYLNLENNEEIKFIENNYYKFSIVNNYIYSFDELNESEAKNE